MRVGLAIIARDEADTLPALLESITGAFDRVVLLDTGSIDYTVELFEEWAIETNQEHEVGEYEWTKDFAAARNAADRLLLFGDAANPPSDSSTPLVDWRSWADCDDVVVGAANARYVCENAPPEVTALFAHYDYAQHEGKTVIALRRERFVRSTYHHEWVGRVHEATPIVSGGVQQLPESLIHWKHRKSDEQVRQQKSNVRNLEILEQWNEDEPNNPRVVGYLGIENMVQGKIAEAAEWLEQYLTLDSQWAEEIAQMHRKLFQCLMILDKEDRAEEIALRAPKWKPSWPDNWLSLAEWNYQQGAYEKCIEWASMALDKTPDTMLIINPNDYTFLPRKLLALALGRLGQLDRALRASDDALAIYPDQMLVQETYYWRSDLKRETTAQNYVQMSEQLLAHDEQLKAREVLECVPVFAYEHPAVVAQRTKLGTRLQWISEDKDFADHYEFGGSKPEDFIKDENVTPLCEFLPRTQFLLAGIREQLDEAGE